MILWFMFLHYGCLSLMSVAGWELRDANFGIPPTSPATYSSAPVYGNGFKMDLYDTFNDDTKNLNITDLVLDLESGVLEFIAVLKRSLVTARSYQILNSTFLGIPAFGSGKFNFTLIGVTFHFKCKIAEYQKFNETYLEIVDYTLTSSVERVYIFFENLLPQTTSSQQLVTDINAYIDLNWKKFYKQLSPVYETYMGSFIYYPFNVIFSKVPKGKLFLP